jgi:hypothetical protein
MIVRSFTHHFVERFVCWRGEMPSIEAVNGLIESGQQLRPQVELFQRTPEGLRRFTILAEYWNDEAGVILRVDESSETAVTLISAGRKKVFRRARPGAPDTQPCKIIDARERPECRNRRPK